MTSLSSESEYSSKYDVINDFRDCNLQIEIDEIQEYIDFLKNDLQILERKKIVFLTSKPNEVVLTHLFSDYVSNLWINGQIFTTSKAALTWLSNQNIDYLDFENIIAEIKTLPDNVYNS
ncbi:MAG: hypothetical protein K9H49_10100 [Bacteroidales bacterium]|nr:hypothetical protein [Bacteroidales bacterium]